MSEKPKKYIFIGGVMKLNPAYPSSEHSSNTHTATDTHIDK